MRLLIPALLALTFVGCSCQRHTDDADGAANAAQTDAPATNSPATPSAAELRAQATEKKRNEAMNEAVDTLHRYLQRIGAGDTDAAAKFWGYQRAPRGNEEADLRTLKNLRGLRIENEAPEPLDKEAVPELLRIPVELRATLENGENRRYKGWYRLRRNQVEQRWELTGVLVAVTLQ
ncbi:hypothetical protein J5226_23145 [Lysobacter sp. K5869]|uniref:hypothetical protein n=1 Tax=Lysobacter sp. K5869 TaxID=2820808 RepID=UPI001C06356B|nr:hypothetical protein [Lysobacter sp. K5869]QWP76446.1 hypothetical protein J5226_23145 [Lysobacter sp. K5869]